MLPEGAIPIHPITGWRSLVPSSFTRRPISLPHGLLSLWEADGLTTFRVRTKNGVGLACSPVAHHLRQEILQLLFLATYLLVQASQHLWLVRSHDV
jgi:hypothetical protein